MSECTIVIGAGVAGMAAASKLKEAGKKVVVVEASDHAGGRMVRLTRNGDFVEAGAQGIHTNYTETLKLVEKYGLTKDIIHQSNDQTCFLSRTGEKLFPAGHMGIFKMLGLRGSLDLGRFLTRHMLMMKDFSLFETHRDIPEYDDISVADALKWAGPAFRDFVLLPGAHAMVGTDLNHTNLYHFLNLMKLVLTTKVMTLRNGLASLPEAIASTLDVRYSSPVRTLLIDGQKITGVELESGERIHGSHVVIACPIGAAAKIIPDHLAPTKDFLSSFPNVPLSLVYFYLDQPLDTKAYCYFGHAYRRTTFNMALNHTVKTPHLVPSGKGIISAWPCYPDSAVIDRLTDTEVKDKALRDMEIFFPGIAGMVEHAYVQRHRWGLSRMEPRIHAKILAFKQQAERLPGVLFANSDYDGVHMESGVRAGLRAAAKVMSTS
ncbi:protoporphyrinogen/coproporphyrinogen oxidase [Pseudomonas veronii]|uniref:protoporphyrinogen/coproporphyrinogen oxidase n=1 Tax=Pseudomonas veronii TaxID=76761 RepID=UPI0021BEB815|nr:NAD(P)/FAD-dependent oxidoreductase [Pseudomonas veronii]MCT9826626.1 FAD-dependent oxidoreductase [Pseudomonas veronii]